MLLLLLIHLSLAWQMFDWSVAQPQQHSPWFWTLTPFFLPQESTSADANDSKVEEVKEEAVETEGQNAYDGLPRGLLKCQVCDKEMWDGVVYIFWPLTNNDIQWELENLKGPVLGCFIDVAMKNGLVFKWCVMRLFVWSSHSQDAAPNSGKLLSLLPYASSVPFTSVVHWQRKREYHVFLVPDKSLLNERYYYLKYFY